VLSAGARILAMPVSQVACGGVVNIFRKLLASLINLEYYHRYPNEVVADRIWPTAAASS